MPHTRKPQQSSTAHRQGAGARYANTSSASSANDSKKRGGISGKIDGMRGKGVRAAVGFGKKKPEKAPKPPKQKKPNFIARLVNQWFDRVMGAVKGDGLAQQEAEYAAHKTTRDFVCNSVGAGAMGIVFPAVTMVSSQVLGAEQAGVISMAFTIALLLMFVGNFGMRTYQISDINEKHSFNDYQVARWGTCILMLIVGALYCMVRGYSDSMFQLCMGIFLYKSIDSLADVYEGRLQQKDKLYLGGISQCIRSVLSVLTFSVTLALSRNAVAASYAMAIAAILSFAVVTYPLTLLETPRAQKASLSSITLMMKNTAPVFVALFLFNLIDSMPKFVMEGVLSYDNQLYYNALYFPAQFILLTGQAVYKPLLVRMVGVWQDASKRRNFDLMTAGICAIVVGITAVTVLVMSWIGIPLLSLLYGTDFEEYRELLYIMVVTGGVTAAIDFFYQLITLMRRQKDVTALYLITFGFSLFIPVLMIQLTGLPGAVLSYLTIMSIMCVLLVWEYARIRRGISQGHHVIHEVAKPSETTDGGAARDDGAARAGKSKEGSESTCWAPSTDPNEENLRPSEARERRRKREEVMDRRVKNRLH